MFRTDGHNFALQQLGLKTASVSKMLKSPYGDLLVRLPFQSAAGAVGGMGVAKMTDTPLSEGAATGAATGALGGLTLAAVPAARRKLIELLSGKVMY